MKQANEKKSGERLCYTCNVKPRMKRNSYCSGCHTERTMKAQARVKARQEKLVVNLERVGGFLEAISRIALDLEVANTPETRRYLRSQIDRESGNLALLATGVIKAQIR